ncbi:YARHG domain-containing protein [Sulfurovum sp. NBC37-1]|uniref:YARHG domain-containing protein n=1 Tax=Sulfurovum sp. (strain NBC37-1) TaxID=387093 RepID=UPI00015874CF|nr:YARHG domain-containing protein [Sulfurovum sp. NBC37-1]BAF71775.1 hypothetical protein SUN_0817 [Sulfurovum sp. NBC37-1]
MNKFWATLTICTMLGWGNDGVFYGSGNQLIPIVESDISISWEVLEIKRIDRWTLDVNVQYHFYNPGSAKQLHVGFEAPSPLGPDVEAAPKNGQHPYITHFSVEVNDKPVSYQCVTVADKNYLKDGKIQAKSMYEIAGNSDLSELPFLYVYHFNADFAQGDNTVTHHYRYSLSGTTDDAYYFDYILTAAKRWANKHIDNFTLSIDLGLYQNFVMKQSFFSNPSEWNVNGIVQKGKCTPYEKMKECAEFFVIGGPIVYQKKNFKIRGDLSIVAPLKNLVDGIPNYDFDYRNNRLPFGIDQSLNITNSHDKTSYRILRNLPYARRGYVFKTPEIRRYYEAQPWYRPNPSYKAALNKLTPQEKEWLKKLTIGD